MPPKQAVWEALRKNLNIKFEAHTTLKKGFNLHLYNPYRLIAAHSHRLEAEYNPNSLHRRAHPDHSERSTPTPDP